MLLYDSLFWSAASEDPEPWLATKAVPSHGNKVWTVTLRTGVTWHDGQPLTADDVRFSFEYYAKQARSTGRYAHHVFDVPPLQTVTVLNERTVRFTYRSPAPTFPLLPGADVPIVPAHLWREIVDPGGATQQLPVGSGPFRMVEIVPERRYRLEANDRYFRGRPRLDAIELTVVGDEESAFAGLRAGDFDLVARNVPPALAPELRATPGVSMARGTRLESVQIYFNAAKPPLSDLRLRKAISLAIDTTVLVEALLPGAAIPGVDTFVHPDSMWAVPTADHEHDPARGNAVLDEAGYRERDADGVRLGPDGSRLEFRVLVSADHVVHAQAMELVEAQVSRIGVHLVADVVDPETLLARRLPPALGQTPLHDAWLSMEDAHAHLDPDALYFFFHSPGERGFGFRITGYANPKFDAIAEKASTMERTARTKRLHELQRILAADAPVITLWYRHGDYAYRSAAYNGWRPEFGHGILTKRSFLAAGRNRHAAEPTSAEPRRGLMILVAVIVLALLPVAIRVYKRRHKPCRPTA